MRMRIAMIAFDTGGDDIVIEEEVEEQIDPRWNELKKILDNN